MEFSRILFMTASLKKSKKAPTLLMVVIMETELQTMMETGRKKPRVNRKQL